MSVQGRIVVFGLTNKINDFIRQCRRRQEERAAELRPQSHIGRRFDGGLDRQGEMATSCLPIRQVMFCLQSVFGDIQGTSEYCSTTCTHTIRS